MPGRQVREVDPEVLGPRGRRSRTVGLLRPALTSGLASGGAVRGMGVVEEEAQHLPRRVGPARVGVGAARAAAGPGVAAAVHHPLLEHRRPAGGGGVQRAAVDSAARARYDVAHECGHLALHRGVGQEDVEDPKVLRRIEDEANRFAGALLLPRQSFPNEVFTTRLDAFVELKMRWKVAIQAMVYRCKDLGVFDEYQITNVCKQISARKWRTKEPLDDPNTNPLEQPKLLRKAVSMILDAKRKTPDDLAAELALAPGIIETLCNLDEGTLSAVEPMLPQPSLR